MPEKSGISVSHEQRLAEWRSRWDREKQALADAEATIALFNAHMVGRHAALFWPTIGTALLAKYPWVRIACESCGAVNELDLRMKPRDPDAAIRVVLRDIRCPRCNGHSKPRIIGLTKFAS